MTYALKSDLQTALGDAELIQLTDRADPPLGDIDDAVLTRALEAADGEINSYLATRYSLPLAATTAVLRDCAIDIARYRLHDRAAPDRVAQDYKDRIAWLILISTGKASLGVADADAPSGVGAPDMTSGGRDWGRDQCF